MLDEVKQSALEDGATLAGFVRKRHTPAFLTNKSLTPSRNPSPVRNANNHTFALTNSRHASPEPAVNFDAAQLINNITNSQTNNNKPGEHSQSLTNNLTQQQQSYDSVTISHNNLTGSVTNTTLTSSGIVTNAPGDGGRFNEQPPKSYQALKIDQREKERNEKRESRREKQDEQQRVFLQEQYRSALCQSLNNDLPSEPPSIQDILSAAIQQFDPAGVERNGVEKNKMAAQSLTDLNCPSSQTKTHTTTPFRITEIIVLILFFQI